MQAMFFPEKKSPNSFFSSRKEAAVLVYNLRLYGWLVWNNNQLWFREFAFGIHKAVAVVAVAVVAVAVVAVVAFAAVATAAVVAVVAVAVVFFLVFLLRVLS